MVEASSGPTKAARSSAWERYWFGEASLLRLAVFRIVMAAAAYYALFQFRQGVLQHADGLDAEWVKRDWNPIYFLELLRLGAPGPSVARVVFWSTYCAILCLWIGLRTRLATLLVALLLTYWIGVAYSFGKPHHDCIALIFGLWALTLAPCGERLSLDAILARGKHAAAPLREQLPLAALPLRFTQITIVLGYLFAGGTKLAVSGLEYLNGYSLQAHMLSFDALWSEYFSRHVELVRWMTIGLVGVQVLFPLVLVLPWTRWFFLPMGILFHLIAWATMDTGPFLTLWFPYAAFVPWERAHELWRRAWSHSSAARACSLALGLAATLGTAMIYFRFFDLAAYCGAISAILVLARIVRRS